MNVLIFNCGSSSQGFKVYQTLAGAEAKVIASGKARNVATPTRAGGVIDWQINGNARSRAASLPTHRQAAEEIIAILKANQVSVAAIGHRFVHGGALFDHTVRIDAESMPKLKQCLRFAPIHNPNTYSVIEVCLEQYAGIPQYAVFDTSFHAMMPEASRRYALPRELAEKHGFHKYGFHGLSYQYVTAQTAALMGRPLAALKLILCHLGTGGSSVTAVKDGKSLDTSMGYSPLAGLVMSTRCGDLDPEIVLEMVRSGYTPEQIERILNTESGLIGLSELSSNLQEIIAEAGNGNPACQLAYEVYAQRLKKYLGAFTWLLNGADAIVFTDDLGVKAWQLREKVCSNVENLGIEIDVAANHGAPADRPALISNVNSRTQIWVMPTDEEQVILNEIIALN